MTEHDYLMMEVEHRFGGAVASPCDFACLKDKIRDETGELISISTLKRLWGYVHGCGKVRTSTLDVLSRYVGRRDWHHFISTIDTSWHGDLVKGDSLVLKWGPSRQVSLAYEGDNIFMVSDPGTTKLEKGDHFKVIRRIGSTPPRQITKSIYNQSFTSL